jgi:hypothetical protein
VLVLWCLVFIPLGKTQEQGSSNKLHPWQWEDLVHYAHK